MTKVFYFSGSGHTFAVAKAISEMISCEIVEMDHAMPHPLYEDRVVIVFPVYCQNIPKPVKAFLKQLAARHVVLIATYGRISYGNVLYEAQKLVHGEVIAGAYIPTGHTFLAGERAFDTACLRPIAERIQDPKPVTIPKSRKSLWANIFPGFRSRVGTRLWRTDRCDHCGLCQERCPVNAIKAGRITAKCIRCLRCAANCPKGALRYKNRWILHQYLKNYWNDHLILYL